MAATVVYPIESATGRGIARLLDDEQRFWRERLFWDFAPTRRRIEAAFAERTLEGFIAEDEDGACGYATGSFDGHAAIIGSIFVGERARDTGLEANLASRVLEGLLRLRPRVIDCQTLFSSAPDLIGPFAARAFASATRLYMTVDRATWLETARSLPPLTRTRPTPRMDVGALARLVYDAHEAGLALDASSSFDTAAACERILRQIVVDNLCGPFDAEASRRVEIEGRTVAACLITWPLTGVAHVSEVATAPDARRRGLARRCLTESLTIAFEQKNATAATLSVTASNQSAIALYASLGFTVRIRYGSHVLRQ